MGKKGAKGAKERVLDGGSTLPPVSPMRNHPKSVRDLESSVRLGASSPGGRSFPGVKADGGGMLLRVERAVTHCDMNDQLVRDHERRMRERALAEAGGTADMKEELMRDLGSLASYLGQKFEQRRKEIAQIPTQLNDHEAKLRRITSEQDRCAGVLTHSFECMSFLNVDVNAVDEAEVTDEGKYYMQDYAQGGEYAQSQGGIGGGGESGGYQGGFGGNEGGGEGGGGGRSSSVVEVMLPNPELMMSIRND